MDHRFATGWQTSVTSSSRCCSCSHNGVWPPLCANSCTRRFLPVPMSKSSVAFPLRVVSPVGFAGQVAHRARLCLFSSTYTFVSSDTPYSYSSSALNLLIMTTPACTVPSSGDKTITLPGDRKVNFATKRLPEPYLVALGSTRQKEVRDEPRLPSLLLSGQTIKNTLTVCFTSGPAAPIFATRGSSY